MEISIYGTRGSVPVSGREFNEFGGNTTCVGVRSAKGKLFLLDAGTGIRKLNPVQDTDIELLLTHTHWDHIQGLPFFGPAYNPQRNISIYCGNGADLYTALNNQHAEYNFPVGLDVQGGVKTFVDFLAGQRVYDSPELQVDTMLQNHPKQGSVAYRFTEKQQDGSVKIFVFGTDYEPDDNGFDERMLGFWNGANLVFADFQYEPRDSLSTVNRFMKGWGHSDYKTGVDTALLAGVEKIVGTHFDPSSTDKYLEELELRVKEYGRIKADEFSQDLECELAREGEVYHL